MRAERFSEHAARYAELGWALIPVDGKKARGNDWQRTQPDAPPLAAGKWSRWGDRWNIGVVCGPSGLAILDVDVSDDPDGAARELLGGVIPPTPVVRTGSGKLQVYFVDPGGLRKTAREGFELRVGEHMCVLPPSEHPDTQRAYAWEPPPWEVTLAPLPQRLVAFFAARRDKRTPAEPLPPKLLPGGRHAALLSLAGTLRRRGLSADEMLPALRAFNETRCDPPKSDDELSALAADVAARYAPGATVSMPPATNPFLDAQTQTDGVREGRRLTDDGNAYRLVDAHGRDLRYLPGDGWYAWDGTRWLHDSSGEVIRRARQLVRTLHAEADEGEGEKETKALRAHAKASASRRGLDAMVALARSDRRVLVQTAQLDADPYLLNAPNGTIDLRTGELRAHERGDLLTRRVAVPYDPAALAPTWLGFCERVQPVPDVRTYLQRLAGSAAVGHNADELIHVFWGGGANGKTKFAETIRTALGDYAVTAPAELFLANRHQSSAQPELVRLRGARLLTASEVDEGSRLNVALVKALTGGDTIAARYLYANEVVEFVPVFSPWLRTNNRPAIREQSEAIWRRVRLVPFTVTIPHKERDVALQGRLNAELDGILAWIVQGAVDYLRYGLTPPKQVATATDAYRDDENVLGAFIADCCLVGDDLSAPAAALYAAWETWAKANGEKPGTTTSFGRALADLGYPAVRNTEGKRARAGIALRGPLDDEATP